MPAGLREASYMSKFTIIAVIAVILFSATLASAQSTTVTLESNLEGAENISALYCQDNFFAFAQYCEGDWSQAYAGLSYADNIGDVAYQVALGAGAETNGFRYGGWIWAGEGKFSFIHCFEGGGSGPWHRTIVKYQATDKVSLGVTDRSFYGRGVRAEVKISASTKLIGEYYEGGKSTLALSTSF